MNEPAAVAPLPDVRTSPHDPQRQGRLKLAVGAIGIVFGDIGTSPIYAFRETFVGHHPIAPDPLHIHGVLSLIFWSMMIVVTIKYVGIILRADNNGEGGSLALLALISRKIRERRWRAQIVLLGIFACALFYGDSMITPAISVLSAVEGLQTVEPGSPPSWCPSRGHPRRALLDPGPRHGPASAPSSGRSCWFISRRFRYSGSCTSPATRRLSSTR